jgi:hypothetical protein
LGDLDDLDWKPKIIVKFFEKIPKNTEIFLQATLFYDNPIRHDKETYSQLLLSMITNYLSLFWNNKQKDCEIFAGCFEYIDGNIYKPILLYSCCFKTKLVCSLKAKNQGRVNMYFDFWENSHWHEHAPTIIICTVATECWAQVDINIDELWMLTNKCLSFWKIIFL